MTILEAMDDPQLYGPFFTGPSWNAWRAFLATAWGLPLSADLRAIAERCTARTALPAAPVKEAWLPVGRRGGKSRVIAFLATYTACFRDYHQFLAPGETAIIPIIAADMDQATIAYRYTLGFLENIPMLRRLIVGEPKGQSVTLETGVTIRVRAASYRTVRGPAIPLAICDEIAFWRTADSANPDHEIIKALKPGMLTIPGAMLVGLSSPYSRRGVLWERYRAHFGKDESTSVLVWKADTTTMNPMADAEEIANAYAEDPAAAAAEFGAEFRTDLQAFIAREVVEACTLPDRHELPPIGGGGYVGFVDPSGGSADSFTLAIAHAEQRNGQVVAVLDVLREQRPPFSPDGVTSEFAELLKAYGLTTVTADKYAGQWVVEAFLRHGIHCEQNAEPKTVLYGGALPLLNAHRAELLDVGRLAAQLVALERRTAWGGRDSIDHPPGGHDDLANAAAGALVLAAQHAGTSCEPLAMGLRDHPHQPVNWAVARDVRGW